MKNFLNFATFFYRSHLNIAGIENFPDIQDHLPHCWSEPALGNILRHNLEPPLLQQAAFDDTVSGF
jgi:tau tubulin kinase